MRPAGRNYKVRALLRRSIKSIAAQVEPAGHSIPHDARCTTPFWAESPFHAPPPNPPLSHAFRGRRGSQPWWFHTHAHGRRSWEVIHLAASRCIRRSHWWGPRGRPRPPRKKIWDLWPAERLRPAGSGMWRAISAGRWPPPSRFPAASRVPALAARPKAFRFGKGGDFTNSLGNQHCVSWLGCGVHYCDLHPTYSKSYWCLWRAWVGVGGVRVRVAWVSNTQQHPRIFVYIPIQSPVRVHFLLPSFVCLLLHFLYLGNHRTSFILCHLFEGRNCSLIISDFSRSLLTSQVSRRGRR